MVQLTNERDEAVAEAAEAKAVADDAIATHHQMKAEIKVIRFSTVATLIEPCYNVAIHTVVY